MFDDIDEIIVCKYVLLWVGCLNVNGCDVVGLNLWVLCLVVVFELRFVVFFDR